MWSYKASRVHWDGFSWPFTVIITLVNHSLYSSLQIKKGIISSSQEIICTTCLIDLLYGLQSAFNVRIGLSAEKLYFYLTLPWAKQEHRAIKSLTLAHFWMLQWNTWVWRSGCRTKGQGETSFEDHCGNFTHFLEVFVLLISPEDAGLADSHPLQPTASGYIKWIQASDEQSQEEKKYQNHTLICSKAAKKRIKWLFVSASLEWEVQLKVFPSSNCSLCCCKMVRGEPGNLRGLCMAAQVGSASLFLAPLSALEIPTVTR